MRLRYAELYGLYDELSAPSLVKLCQIYWYRHMQLKFNEEFLVVHQNNLEEHHVKDERTQLTRSADSF